MQKCLQREEQKAGPLVIPDVVGSGGGGKGTPGWSAGWMAAFLGMVATKHFPWLLHGSDCCFPECYENPQLPSRLWVGVSRPPLLPSNIH